MNGIKTIALIFLVGFFCFSTIENATAQFPRIGKVKLPKVGAKKTDKKTSTSDKTTTTTEKETTQETPKESPKTTTTTSKSETNTTKTTVTSSKLTEEQKAKILADNAGKALAYTKYGTLDFKETVNVEDDLFLKFVFDKTLQELATEQGLGASDKIYAMVKIQLDKGEAIAGPFEVDAQAAPMLTAVDFVLNVLPNEFTDALKKRQNELTMADMVVLTLWPHPKNTQKRWIQLMAGNMQAGKTQKAKAALYFVKDEKSKTPIGKALAAGEFQVKTTEAGIQKLYSSGRVPAKYQPKPDNGITHDLHSKNMNKIVWSTNEITKAETSDAAFKNSFSSLAGGIYGRVYLPKSIHNYGASIGDPNVCNYALNFYLDGKLAGHSHYNKMEDDACEKWTTWQVVLAPLASDDYAYSMSEDFANMLKKTKEGTHKLKVEMVFNYLEGNDTKSIVMASSDLSFSTSKSDKDKFVDKHGTKYVKPSATSGGSSNRVRITVENKSGSTVKYSIMGNGMSESSSLRNNEKTSINAPIGYFLQINGSDYHKTSKGDEGKTITVR